MAATHRPAPTLHPARTLRAAAAAWALAIPAQLPAQPQTQPEEEHSVKSAFPTLDILPEGSILRRVRLPRYDKDFVPVSLLTAETLTVLDKERIDGLGITIHLYAKDGSVNARTKMRHAIYNQKRSTLHASEAVLIQGKNYTANGTGLVFDWKHNRGLLFGPVKTKFTRVTPAPSSAMHIPRPTASLAGSLVALTGMSTSLIAVPPAKLTPAQIAEMEQLSRPIGPQVESYQRQTRLSLDEDDRLSAKADAAMAPFLKSIGQASLLVQNTPAEKEEPAAPSAAPKAPAEETLKVTCDGGLYFDSDTGILAYLKNVRLTEPRFTLSCTDELKVFLDKKQPDEKKPGAQPGDNPEPAKPSPAAPGQAPAKKDEAKKNDGLGNFGDIKRIIATGKVRVTRKDDQGKLFIATAEQASYDAKSGEMILRGGLPRLQLSANQYLQSNAPGQHIRILGNGKFITEGKWTMVTPTKVNKPRK